MLLPCPRFTGHRTGIWSHLCDGRLGLGPAYCRQGKGGRLCRGIALQQWLHLLPSNILENHRVRFSVATGAAIGRESSMIQFATAATSWVGSRRDTTGFSLARKVACGVSAAIAAAYQAPIAGVFFVYEIVLGEWRWEEAPDLAVSAVVGWLVSRTLLGAGPLFVVHGLLPLGKVVAWTIPLTLLLACLGPAYQSLLHSARFLRKVPAPLIWGGLTVGLLSLLHPTVWGNGDVALTDALTGKPVLQAIATVLLLRSVATAICTGAGTRGGTSSELKPGCGRAVVDATRGDAADQDAGGRDRLAAVSSGRRPNIFDAGRPGASSVREPSETLDEEALTTVAKACGEHAGDSLYELRRPSPSICCRT